MTFEARPIDLETVATLVADIVLTGAIDDPDFRSAVRPFMAALRANGFPWQDDRVPAAVVETFRSAREAVRRLCP